MPLDAQMLDCACRISSIDSLLGTGFLITVKSEGIEEARYGYVVTAQHVVANQLEISVEAADPFNAGLLHPPVEITRWRHPLPEADLALAPFPPRGDVVLAIELEKHVAPNEAVPAPRLGAHIYYLGIFQPLDRVMARSGTIGALNQLIWRVVCQVGIAEFSHARVGVGGCGRLGGWRSGRLCATRGQADIRGLGPQDHVRRGVPLSRIGRGQPFGAGCS